MLLPGGSTNLRSLDIGDVNGDGFIDIVRGHRGGFDRILMNKGKDETASWLGFEEPMDLPGTSSGDITGGIKLALLNDDEHLDIVRCKTGTSHVCETLLGNGDGTFQDPLPVALPDSYTSASPKWRMDTLEVGDLDGNGILDLVITTTSYEGQSNESLNYVPQLVLLGNGDGTFTFKTELGRKGTGFSVAIADLNMDGKLDLAFDISMEVVGAPPMYFLGNGDGTFLQPIYLPLLATGNSVAVDYDSKTVSATSTATSGPTNWEIVLPDTNPEAGDVVVDFSETSGPGSDTSGDLGTITTKYVAWANGAPNAILETFLVDGVCAASSSGQATPINSTGTCSNTGTEPATSCTYEFDKTNMAANYYYDPTAATLKVCEVAQLMLPKTENDPNPLIIEQYFTDVELQFNTTAGFSVTGITMEKATISENTQETTLSDYISAIDCTGVSPLPPNTPLCIEISSSSDDVLIESIDEMDIGGTDPNNNANTLPVVDGGGIVYGAITSYNTTLPSKSIQVNTRVPANQFDFEATNAAIEVTGSVTLKFAGRRLRVDIDRLLQAANNEETASFDINVQLASEPELAIEGGDEVMMNSANAAAGKTFAILGMVFAASALLCGRKKICAL
jgi:hypothetical protein